MKEKDVKEREQSISTVVVERWKKLRDDLGQLVRRGKNEDTIPQYTQKKRELTSINIVVSLRKEIGR